MSPPQGGTMEAIERLLGALTALCRAGQALSALAPSRWLRWLLDPSAWR